LCRRHNREKSARLPWNWQLNRLAKRRASYFPLNHDPIVVRQRPPPARVATPTPTPSPRHLE
jgi:hypothetical protein